MRQLEIVELRSLNCEKEEIRDAVKTILDSAHREFHVDAIRVYRHTAVGTDMAVHILHEAGTVLPGGSRLGYELTEFLRGFGLVHHELWMQMEPDA